MLLCVVIDATTTGQQPGVRVNPIPAVERFVQGTGLRVRLTVAKSSLAAFEDPGFVVRLDNVGSAPVRVNPNVESNLYIYDEHGRFVPRQSAEERDTLVRAGGVRPRLRCLTHVALT